MEKQEFAPLYARLEDMSDVARRGDVAKSDFLSPRELFYAESYLKARGIPYFCFGGVVGAERQRIYLLPEYIGELQSAEELCEFGFSIDISALKIRTAGYKKLTHRDYLGCVLGLGVERTVLGDIFVLDEQGYGAVMFCKSSIAEFFIRELKKVGSESAKVSAISLDEVIIPERKTASVSDTVASPRLDCVVGALCSLSRDKARTAVESGLVELDFELEMRPDRTVSAPCLVSVRGYGRYRVCSLCDKTRKGRYRLTAEKFL